MDFTREPIIETVITPREGYRLVVRSSKGAGYEEHFVDALEVVSFGSSVFFRCLERPKPFIVPVSDYEVLEVREPRMVLKTPSEAQSSKASSHKVKQEQQAPRNIPVEAPMLAEQEAGATEERPAPAVAQDGRGERPGRRDRRQRFRRKRGQGREEGERVENGQEQTSSDATVEEGAELAMQGVQGGLGVSGDESKLPSTAPMLNAILPPPTRLIRDDLQLLREKDEYKGAFYDRTSKDDDEDMSLQDIGTTSDEEMSFREVPFDISEEEIRMSEGGDQEVPQEGSFRLDIDTQEDESNSVQDVQKE